MTVFSKVVTGVKRRGKVANEAGSSSQVTQLRENSPVTTVAPDLRRFSDFMNPFPSVSPGGYTKYYQAKAKADPGSSQFALPPLCELNQRPPAPRRPPAIQTSGLATKHRSSRKVTSGSKTLESIPESASDPHSAHSHEGRGQDDGPQGSLRRRKRRVLRTPSVERDFAQHALLDVHPTLGRAASTSSQSSSSTSAHSPSHSSSCDASTDSHSSNQSSPSSEFPRTPVDNAPLPRAYLFHDPFDQKGLKIQHPQDWEPYERPDSRSTYRTARTHFDDI